MNCKIKVKDSQHSLDIQQKLFSNGCYRLNSKGEKSTIMKMIEPKFFIVNNDRIDFTDCHEFFEQCAHKEVHINQMGD